MPHLTLEYTSNLSQSIDADQLFPRLHQILVNVGGISIHNCKSRAVCLDTYYIGKGDVQDAFIHLDIRFLEGRSLELKQRIGRLSLSWLKEYFAPSLAELELQVTVGIADIQPQTYFKIPEGTLTPPT
jgi:5-carboxymethyl-2-hydroxymuconate isomerase